MTQTINEDHITQLRRTVRFFYDLQKMRTQASLRATDGPKTAELEDEDKSFLARASLGLNEIEKDTLNEVRRLLKPIPVYQEWLQDQRGVGPTMAGVLISYIDIHRATNPSKIWRVCGLAVRIDEEGNGHAERRMKGVKCSYNPWLKSKVLHVMGGSMLKAVSTDDVGYFKWNGRCTEGKGCDHTGDCGRTKVYMDPFEYPVVWRKIYDDYKLRKQQQTVRRCMGCKGTGTFTMKAKKEDESSSNGKSSSTCANCGGTGGPAPWGASDAHRHTAAMRKMVKEFLVQLYENWRKIEGLPVRGPYREEYLGMEHSGPAMR